MIRVMKKFRKEIENDVILDKKVTRNISNEQRPEWEKEPAVQWSMVEGTSEKVLCYKKNMSMSAWYSSRSGTLSPALTCGLNLK